VSKTLRAFILSQECETEWLRAIREMGIPELEAGLKPVQLATLVSGRFCRVRQRHLLSSRIKSSDSLLSASELREEHESKS